jgi:16S rRNA C1402 (ribose-2'-O) methylase RsmI
MKIRKIVGKQSNVWSLVNSNVKSKKLPFSGHISSTEANKKKYFLFHSPGV